MMNMILHIANPDKFTLPLSTFINKKEELSNHRFLFLSDQFDKNKYSTDSLLFLKSPIRKRPLNNLFLFFKLCYSSDVIIMHGGSGIALLKIFPWFTKKIVWVINGAELYNLTKLDQLNNANNSIFSRARVHLTHIEGDSSLANEILQSKATFHYSPMYLSNVVSTQDFCPSIINNKVKILVGNSNSSNNDHHKIFNKLKQYENEIEYIVSPLSYGNDLNYKESVKLEGFKLFGEKFKPIEDFMEIEKYRELLKSIDIAVFNHWRQEAMGVTLTLLSLGKIVYVNPNTTSFESLVKRGFKIFDNNVLFTEGPLIQRNISDNRYLLEKYYSEETLIDSLKTLEI